MKYIKVYDSNSQIVDALPSIHFVYWNSISNMIDDCSDTDARRMGILSFDASTIWHLSGRPNFPQEYEFVTCQYTEIDRDEYEAIRAALDNQDDNPDDPDVAPQPTPPDDPVDDNTVEMLREAKINELSKICENVITSGVTVPLSDGEQHHFALTEYDQLNLFKLETIARSGEMTVLPYHEDDELCRYYPAIDIITIADVATEYIAYHTTYFNSLKHYVKSLNTVNDIITIKYGCDIPEEFQSDVWKGIINGGEL